MHTHTKTPLLPTITPLFSPSCMILRGKKGKEREKKKIDGIKFTRVVGFLSLIKVCFLYKRRKKTVACM